MRRALIVTGVLVMAYALVSTVTDPQVDLIGVLVFGLAVLALHDGVLLPAVLAAGALINRIVPPGWRATVRIAVAVDLAVAVVALPLVVGSGHDSGNPTVLPRPYTLGLILILVLVPAAVAACRKGIERSRVRRGRRRPG